MSKYSNFCYYYEFIDHYLGSKHVKHRIPISKLDEMAEKYMGEDDDEAYDWMEELGVFWINEALNHWDDVRKDLETKGIFGTTVEEGSFAISMDSMEDARRTVAELELEVHMETGGW